MKITTDDIIMPTETSLDICKDVINTCKVCETVMWEHDKPHTLTDCLLELKIDQRSNSCSCGRNR